MSLIDVLQSVAIGVLTLGFYYQVKFNSEAVRSIQLLRELMEKK